MTQPSGSDGQGVAGAPSAWDRASVQYGVGLAAVALATVLRAALDPWLNATVPFMFYVPVLIVLALYARPGPVIAAAATGLLVGDYLFLEPRGTVFIGGTVVDRLRECSYLLAVGGAVFVAARARMVGRAALEEVETSRRTAAALRESEALLRAVHEAMFDAMCVHEDGKVVDVNAAFERLLGLGRSEVIGRPVMEAFLSASGAEERALEEVGWPREVTLERRDGSRLVAEVRTREAGVAGRRLRVTTANDVTARKRALEALEESEARYRASFERAAVGVARVDPETGRFIEVNRRLCEITGYAAHELLGMTYKQLTHPEDLEKGADSLRRLMRGESREHSVEKRYIRKDGGVRRVQINAGAVRDSRGKARYLVATFADTTARARAEEAQLASEARLRLALEASRLGTWDIDLTTGQSRESARMAEMIGLSDSGAPHDGAVWAERVHPDDLERVRAEFAAATAGSGRFDTELRMVLPDGGVRWLAAVGAVHRDELGRPVSAAGVAADITERKEVQERLRQSEERFRLALSSGAVYVYEQTADLRYTWVYPDAGLARAGAVGRTDAELLADPAEAGVLTEIKSRVLRTGRAEHREVKVTMDGRTHSLNLIVEPRRDARGRVVGVGGAAFDVTDRAEAELVRARMAAIVESSQDAVIGKSLDGIITDWNAAAERLYGYTAAEALGRSIFMLIPEERREEEGRILSTLRAGERVEHFETVRLTKSGERVHVSLAVSPIRDGQGRLIGASKVARDITARKRAEEALRESEAKLRLITDAAPALISYVDTALVYRACNRAYEEWFGVPRELVVGHHMLDVLGPEAFEAIEPWMEAALLGRAQSFETYAPYARGGGRHIQASYIPHTSESGEVAGVFVMVTDVTERKRAADRHVFLVRMDDALRPLTDPEQITAAAAKLLGEHLGASRCAYADVEEDQDTFNLAGDYNRGVSSIVGRYRFEQFGAECLRMMRQGEPFVVEDVGTDPRTAAVREAYRQAEVAAVVCVPLHKGGRLVAAMAVHQNEPRRWRTDEVELLQRVAARCWESIERAKVTRVLRESEERFRMAVDAAEMGTWTWYPASDTVVCDARMRSICGFLPDQELRHTDLLAGTVHPEEAGAVANALRNASDPAGDGRYTAEFRVRRPDGTERWVLAHGRMNFSPQGTPLMMTGTGLDITERKLIESELSHYRHRLEELVQQRTAELERTHHQLRMSERMAALGTLSLGLGHDMGNLLLPIRARVDVLAARQDLPEDIRESLEPIRTCAEYLQNLSRGLRLFALDPDDENAASNTTPLGLWAKEALPFFKNSLGKKIAFEHDLPADLPSLAVAPHRLTQAVLNLITNARDAIGPGASGTVTLRARPSAGGTKIAVSVSDDGPGMTPEVRSRCLEPFFTTKTRGVSTGLGLALVHGIVQRCDGEVHIDSAPGEGTTITLVLPATVEPVSGDDEGAAVAAVSVRDARVGSMVAGLLRAMGFDVRVGEAPDAEAELWVVEPGEGVLPQALRFARSGDDRRVLAVGAAGEGWDAPGITLVSPEAGLGAIRSAIVRAWSSEREPEPGPTTAAAE